MYILLAPHNIYQKQKTESVYLVPKNNYGMALLVKQVLFRTFPYRNSKNDDVIKNMAPF